MYDSRIRHIICSASIHKPFLLMDTTELSGDDIENIY